MWGKGLLWWNRPMIVLIRSPLQQMTVLHYLLQPWRLWPYWFLDLIASEWLPVTAEGRKNRYEECFSVADSCQSAQWYSSFKGSRPSVPCLSLFLIYRLSDSLSCYLLFWLSIRHTLRATWITSYQDDPWLQIFLSCNQMYFPSLFAI